MLTTTSKNSPLEIKRLKTKTITTDEIFRRRGLEFGRIALAAGDPPVGSLIVPAGEIVSEGIEAVKSNFDPSAHAEILAVRAASKKLQTFDLSGARAFISTPSESRIFYQFT